MLIFYYISSSLTFQMSYIYHQVTILAYKILIKNICTYVETLQLRAKAV